MSYQSQEKIDYYTDENGFFAYQVPKKYALVDLQSCDKQPEEYIDFARKWAKKPSSVFLCGGYGTGKTQFAFAMLREMFRKCSKNLWPRYFTSTQLDSILLKAVKSDDGDEYILDDLSKQDILFIDDIGRETKSDRLRRQYFEILNARYAAEIPTILTSNLSLEKLGDVIDGAIASRIQEWDILEFNGFDMRKQL